MEIPFKVKAKIKLEGDYKSKLKEILVYMFRNTRNKLINIGESEIQAECPFNEDLRTYGTCMEWIRVEIIIYYYIPRFFDLNTGNLDIRDYQGIIDFYWEECKKRIGAEEESEEIPTEKEMNCYGY